MTNAARQVLLDCEAAIEDFDINNNPIAWRRRWVTIVVLLRAIGHVLDKVDSKINDPYKNAISAWWGNIKQQKPEPRIFWEFIDSERNNILKEYAESSLFIEKWTFTHSLKTGQSTSEPIRQLSFSIVDGHFMDKNPIELAKQALDWWREQLDSIDAEAAIP